MSSTVWTHREQGEAATLQNQMYKHVFISCVVFSMMDDWDFLTVICPSVHHQNNLNTTSHHLYL